MRLRGRRKENEKKKKEREFRREKAKKKSENMSKLQRQSTPEQNPITETNKRVLL